MSTRSLRAMRFQMQARRSLSSAVAVLLSLGAVGLLAPAATAAAPYTAPLATAVQQLVVAPENTSPYDREAQFGGDWTDEDGDCLNTRHEVWTVPAFVDEI